MIVCLCHGVRDRDIDAAISEGATTVGEVGRACGAGTGCGACIPDIEGKLERAGRCGRHRAAADAADGDADAPRDLIPLRLTR